MSECTGLRPFACGRCDECETGSYQKCTMPRGGCRCSKCCPSLLDQQPTPTGAESSDNRAVWPLVIADERDPGLVADMIARDLLGRERYGSPLLVWNGRDALADAYQEALDLAVYLEQCRQRVPESTKEWDPYHPKDTLTSLRNEVLGICRQLRALAGKVPVEAAP